MKKITIIGIFMGIMVLSGCSQEEVGKKGFSNPVLEPGEKTVEMADLEKEQQKSVDAPANKMETNKSNSATGEKNMSTPQSTLGDNSALVKKYQKAVLKTSLGDITLKFYGDKTPVTVGNFLKLADLKFYDGVRFHRVIKGFMIQGGDPLSKDDAMKGRWGTGGPGYKFADELTGEEKYPQGTLAMANSGPNTNGSQFFIVTASPAAQLPPSYTVFGEVVSGLDTALAIENVKTLLGDRPEEDVTIKSIELLEK